jgi:hypothetical protein
MILIDFLFSLHGLKMVNHFKNPIDFGHIMMYLVKQFFYKLMVLDQMILEHMLLLLKIHLVKIKHKHQLMFHSVLK